MNSDGSQVEPVVGGGNAPVWSPDGSHIVFMRLVNAGGDWKMRTLIVGAEGGVPDDLAPLDAGGEGSRTEGREEREESCSHK